MSYLVLREFLAHDNKYVILYRILHIKAIYPDWKVYNKFYKEYYLQDLKVNKDQEVIQMIKLLILQSTYVKYQLVLIYFYQIKNNMAQSKRKKYIMVLY